MVHPTVRARHVRGHPQTCSVDGTVQVLSVFVVYGFGLYGSSCQTGLSTELFALGD